MAGNFQEKVLAVVRTIPSGKTMSYKQVAQKAGNPRAFRAVGNILAKNFDSAIPCHRVIKSNDSMGGYNRGRQTKIKILAKEGVVFKSMARYTKRQIRDLQQIMDGQNEEISLKIQGLPSGL